MRRRRRGAAAGSAAPASAIALEGGDERAALGGAERRQGAGQALGVEHRVGGHALGAAAGEHEREPALVARIARRAGRSPCARGP